MRNSRHDRKNRTYVQCGGVTLDGTVEWNVQQSASVASVDAKGDVKSVNGVLPNNEGLVELFGVHFNATIPPNDDLNNYLKGGWFYHELIDTASTVKNTPGNKGAFYVLVIDVNKFKGVITQIYISYNGELVAIRSHYNWGGGGWTPWIEH